MSTTEQTVRVPEGKIHLLVLPHMQCDSECGECCGPVSVTEDRFAMINEYAAEHGIVPIDQGIRCPWYQKGTCSVYEVRPFVCHLYGHIPEMNCPRDYNTNLSEDDAKKAKAVLGALGHPVRYLHEILVEKIPGYRLEGNVPGILLLAQEAIKARALKSANPNPENG